MRQIMPQFDSVHPQGLWPEGCTLGENEYTTRRSAIAAPFKVSEKGEDT